MLAALGMQLVSKYANVVVQLAITMVLARILTPEEHGTVAVVTVFTSFFAILADMGISTAIVQYKDLQKRDFSALFFFSVLLGCALTALFCAISYPISVIYNDHQLLPLCLVASLSVLFNTLNMVPNGVLLREKKFKTISVRLVAVSVLAGICAIVLAKCGFGCYALAWNAILTAMFVFLWNWATTKILPTNVHFIAPLKKIFRFSAFQGAFSIINYFARNFDNILIGATMGAAKLGYYDKAYKLMQYPLNYLTGIFSSVLQPYLSEYQNDMSKLYSSWLGICRILAAVGMFVAAFFFCFAEEIIFVMFGNQWNFAASALVGLSVSIGIQMVNSTSGAIFQSAGRTDSLFKSGLICTFISLVAIVAGVASESIEILGYFISLAYFSHFLLTTELLVHDILKVSRLEFLKNFLPSIMASILSVVACISVGSAINSLPFVAKLILRIATLVGVYALVIVATKEHHAFKAFKEMKKIGVS